MENTNETGKFDMMRDPEIVNAIQRSVNERLDVMIPDLMKKTGLSEIEVLGRLRGQPAVEA